MILKSSDIYTDIKSRIRQISSKGIDLGSLECIAGSHHYAVQVFSLIEREITFLEERERPSIFDLRSRPLSDSHVLIIYFMSEKDQRYFKRVTFNVYKVLSKYVEKRDLLKGLESKIRTIPLLPCELYALNKIDDQIDYEAIKSLFPCFAGKRDFSVNYLKKIFEREGIQTYRDLADHFYSAREGDFRKREVKEWAKSYKNIGESISDVLVMHLDQLGFFPILNEL